MKHILPYLPFSMDALEPWMSQETLSYHYGKHHKAYVDNLNKLIEGTEFEDMSLEQIILNASDGSIFNNAAQAWNHTFFWKCLAQGQAPSDKITRTVSDSFGSVQEFQKQFKEQATRFFGSGWVWLVSDFHGHLTIETSANANNPLRKNQIPVLTCDLWEHAYYIDYRNERGHFLDSFFQLINWDNMERNLEGAYHIAA